MTAPDLRDQLQAALGTGYVIERELGGGGMSRVFVATESALGRKVVIKSTLPGTRGGAQRRAVPKGRSWSPPDCSTRTSCPC